MMTNKEKYKQAFSTLHASDHISLEEKKMESTRKMFQIKPAMAACIAAVLVFGGMGTAYAADLGGIQGIIQSWFQGSQITSQVTDNGDGSYTFFQQDGSNLTGGGVVAKEDGTTTQATAQETADNMSDSVVVKDDGAAWLYYGSESYDISQYLKDGACKVAIKGTFETTYLDIKVYEDGGSDMTEFNKPTGSADAYISCCGICSGPTSGWTSWI